MCYLVHRLVCCTTNLTLSWAVTPGNVDETYLLPSLLVKALFLEVTPQEAVFDNGYASLWSYTLLGLLGVKPFIGFRKKAKPNWRGKPKTLKLRYRKMVNAGVLKRDRLQALDLDPDPDKNSLEKNLSGLMIAEQHEYVGAYYRNLSLNQFNEDGESWLNLYTTMRNMVEGSHGHQKDWLDLDNLRDRGLQKAKLHTALSMLSEGRLHTGSERHHRRIDQPSRSQIGTDKNLKKRLC